jgi:hypothetical protein
MFDNLRDDAASGYDEKPQYQAAASTESVYSARLPSKRFLGMTSFQLFIISFMFFLAVCLTGSLVLFATGKIGF